MAELYLQPYDRFVPIRLIPKPCTNHLFEPCFSKSQWVVQSINGVVGEEITIPIFIWTIPKWINMTDMEFSYGLMDNKTYPSHYRYLPFSQFPNYQCQQHGDKLVFFLVVEGWISIYENV